MKKVLIFQAGLMAVGVLLLAFFAATPQALSYLVGSGLILLCFFLLGIGFGLIFRKKLIALAVGIIVFKYAILGIIIFTVVKQPWFNPLWFAIGVASFALTAVVFAISEYRKVEITEGNENVI